MIGFQDGVFGFERRRRKEEKNKANVSTSDCLDPTNKKSNFPPLREKVPSSIVDDFMEKQAIVIGDIGDVGLDGIDLTRFTDVGNTTATSTINPTEVITPTAGLDVEKNKGNGSNLKDPSTSISSLTNTTSVFTVPTTENGSEKVANVPNDADYDVWLPLASVHEFFSVEGVDSVLCDVWVKFQDVPLFAYTSDGLSLITTRIGTLMMLDSYANSMCLESWERSSYARILIKSNACNDFSDNLVMAVPNLEGTGYMKEIIRVEYEWEPPRYSTCLIFGHVNTNNV
ncbi:hypothetical protein Tco_0529165 [Tanacetum coccineum]